MTNIAQGKAECYTSSCNVVISLFTHNYEDMKKANSEKRNCDISFKLCLLVSILMWSLGLQFDVNQSICL